LATVADRAERRATFEAMAPVWRTVDGDGEDASPYRDLVGTSARRWDADGSPIDANAAVLGVEPTALESMLHAILAAGRRSIAEVAGNGAIEPWDYRYVVGAAERSLAASIPRERLRMVNDAYLRSLGADVGALGISYDIDPRPDRPVVPVAFTIGVGIPARPWVFATYHEGGLGNLGELIHESGHALHYAAIATRPCFAEPPPDYAAYFEAVADLVGWDVGEPAFQERFLGRGVDIATARLDRYGTVLLDVCWALFEIELHRSPDRRPNEVWTEITHDGLGIAAHPEWSWWAVRGQLIESPGYLANYALAAIATAALRARLRSLRGDWWSGDSGWYPDVADRLLRHGAAQRPAELIRAFLGTRLDAGPLLADLGGGDGR
jgi:hypothetical protein